MRDIGSPRLYEGMERLEATLRRYEFECEMNYYEEMFARMEAEEERILEAHAREHFAEMIDRIEDQDEEQR
jgi:hypothetical protein